MYSGVSLSLLAKAISINANCLDLSLTIVAYVK